MFGYISNNSVTVLQALRILLASCPPGNVRHVIGGPADDMGVSMLRVGFVVCTKCVMYDKAFPLFTAARIEQSANRISYRLTWAESPTIVGWSKRAICLKFGQSSGTAKSTAALRRPTQATQYINGWSPHRHGRIDGSVHSRRASLSGRGVLAIVRRKLRRSQTVTA